MLWAFCRQITHSVLHVSSRVKQPNNASDHTNLWIGKEGVFWSRSNASLTILIITIKIIHRNRTISRPIKSFSISTSSVFTLQLPTKHRTGSPPRHQVAAPPCREITHRLLRSGDRLTLQIFSPKRGNSAYKFALYGVKILFLLFISFINSWVNLVIIIV